MAWGRRGIDRGSLNLEQALLIAFLALVVLFAVSIMGTAIAERFERTASMTLAGDAWSFSQSPRVRSLAVGGASGSVELSSSPAVLSWEGRDASSYRLSSPTLPGYLTPVEAAGSPAVVPVPPDGTWHEVRLMPVGDGEGQATTITLRLRPAMTVARLTKTGGSHPAPRLVVDPAGTALMAGMDYDAWYLGTDGEWHPYRQGAGVPSTPVALAPGPQPRQVLPAPAGDPAEWTTELYLLRVLLRHPDYQPLFMELGYTHDNGA